MLIFNELPEVLTFAAAGSGALVTFVLYTLAVFGLAAISSHLLKNRAFLSEYFLGSRSLGVWALALTFAATSASGGSFTGFPSLIYTHGWVLALWIGSYMIFPICTMGLLGKRINQVARKTGAITVPDILRDRFQSPSFSVLASSLLIFFTCVNLVGQFKAGSMILQTLLGDNSFYVSLRDGLGGMVPPGAPIIGGVDPGYLLCLVTFGIAVIIYTTWGGFHAVVWTDVMQGVVMVLGVVIMLPLAIYQVGGMQTATEELAAMVPPHRVELTLKGPAGSSYPKGVWLNQGERIFRTGDPVVLDKSGDVVFADPKTKFVGGIEIVDKGDLGRVLAEGSDVEFSSELQIVSINSSVMAAYPGDDQPGSFVTAPGPHAEDDLGFLPMSLAFSMFFYWAISGTGQPSSMVRLMAFKDTRTLRFSIATVAVYFSLIYFPLVVIFCCSRLLIPGMEVESDRIMPQMAVTLTENIGAGWLAGLLVAAPFAAVMSTVDSFLLMISSSIVRDVYQRNINPQATSRQLQRMSYLCTMLVGVGVVLVATNPPEYLQYLIVYVGSGLSACFLAPVSLALYWKRMNGQGAIGSMVCGFLSHLSLYMGGWLAGDGFTKPLRPFSIDPVVIGIVTSFVAGIVIALATDPPSHSIVAKYFFQKKTDAADSKPTA